MQCCCKRPDCKVNVLLARQAKELTTLRNQLTAEKQRTTGDVPRPRVTHNNPLPWVWPQK